MGEGGEGRGEGGTREFVEGKGLRGKGGAQREGEGGASPARQRASCAGLSAVTESCRAQYGRAGCEC